MSVKTVNLYTCDRCEDTWDTRDKEFNKNSVLLWNNLPGENEAPLVRGRYHLCAQCSSDLKEWLTTLPQAEPSEIGELEMKQIPSCASCQHYTRRNPLVAGVCDRSLQAVSPDYYCPSYESKT